MNQGPGGYGPPGSYGNPPPGWRPPPGGYSSGAQYGAPPGPPNPPPEGVSWSSSEAVSFALDAVKNDYARAALPLVLGTLVIIVGAGILGFVIGFVGTLVTKPFGDVSVVGVALKVLVNLASQLCTMSIQAFILGGMVDFALQVVRGGRPSLETVFNGSRYFVPMLVGQILLTLVVAVGIVLLIVPGIVLALGLLFWPYLVVDKQLGVVEAMKASWNLTMGHKMGLFGYAILSLFIALAGLLACCVGMLLGAVPILSIAPAVIYVRLNGETPSLAAR